MFISHRNEKTNSSEFIEVTSFLKDQTKTFDEVLTVYREIRNNINSYELKDSSTGAIKTDTIRDINVLFYNKLNEFIQSQDVQKKTEIDTINTSILTHLKRAEQRLGKKEVRENVAIVEMYKNRKQDPYEELERLKKIPRVQRALDHLEERSKYWETNTELRKDDDMSEVLTHQALRQLKLKKDQYVITLVAYAQSLEVQETLKNDYYVLNHGQSLDMMVINMIANTFKQHFEEILYKDTHTLRHNVFQEKISKQRDSDWYKKWVKEAGFPADHKFRNELISADFNLQSTRQGESALAFLIQKLNAAKDDLGDSYLKPILQKIIEYYIPDSQTQGILIKEFEKILHDIPTNTANLYSICIPKDKLEQCCYFSKDFGVTLDDETIKKVKDYLKDAQAGNNLQEIPSAQIRILASKLDPNEGVYVYLNSTLEESQIVKLEARIDSLIQNALIRFRLGDFLKEKPDETIKSTTSIDTPKQPEATKETWEIAQTVLTQCINSDAGFIDLEELIQGNSNLIECMMYLAAKESARCTDSELQLKYQNGSRLLEVILEKLKK